MFYILKDILKNNWSWVETYWVLLSKPTKNSAKIFQVKALRLVLVNVLFNHIV